MNAKYEARGSKATKHASSKGKVCGSEATKNAKHKASGSDVSAKPDRAKPKGAKRLSQHAEMSAANVGANMNIYMYRFLSN